MIKIKFNKENLPVFLKALGVYLVSLILVMYAVKNQNMTLGFLALLIMTFQPKVKE